MQRSAKFWDRIAERYARKPVADQAAYQRKLEVTRRYLQDDMEVLELGCGTGSTALVQAPHVRHIRAIDISSKMIEIARDKASAAEVSNVSFEQAAIDDIDVADQSLDAVLALSLLHLVDDRRSVIARVHRMLKPGGVFVTSTACLGDTMGWFRYVGPIGHALGLIPKVRVFTTDELRDSFAGARFDIDHEWHPGKGKAVFMVAVKPAS